MAKNILTKRSFLVGLETNVQALSNNDIANLGQVTALVEGRQNLKDSVRAASHDGNITLSGLQTIDSVELVAGDRVLVMTQTDAATNGIYDVVDGAWTRSIDADEDSELKAYTKVYVRQGSDHKGHNYVLQSEVAIVVGTTDQTWVHTSSIEGNAANITVDSTNLDWAGTNVQEVLESAETAVEANTTNITANGNSISTNATDIDDLESFTGSNGDANLGITGTHYIPENSNLKEAVTNLDTELYANRRFKALAVVVVKDVDKVITHSLGDTRLSSIMVYDNATGLVITDTLDITAVDANSFKLVQNAFDSITVDISCRK